MRKKITLLATTFIICFNFIRSQVPSLNPVNGVVPAILNVAGGSYDNPSSYYRYEWSFGELMLIQAFASADSSIMVTQGVLQPCTDKLGYSAFTTIFDIGDYKLFPNPTPGPFEIDFFVRTPGTLSLNVINDVGQVLQSRKEHYNGCCRVYNFDISGYPDGVYIVAADLKPDVPRPGDNITVVRHSGLKVMKLTNK